MFEVNQGLYIQMLHFKNLLMVIFLSYKFLDCFLRIYGIAVIHPMMNTTLLTSNLCPAALPVTFSYTITFLFHYFVEDILNAKLT